MRTRVKICGITSADDARSAVAAGADALGFVFHRPSERWVAPERVREIRRTLPAFVATVGVVVDLDATELDNMARVSGIDYFQFHGREAPSFCESIGVPYLKALRVQADTDVAQEAGRYNAAAGLLLDAFAEDLPGGTGRVFDWSCIPATLPVPVILAGGLSTANVGAAIQAVRPYAVDVSSGVERRPGVKDPQRIIQFLRSVHAADREAR